MQFNENVLDIKNITDVSFELQSFIKDQVFNKFKKKGAVIGISGGIDSALTCALCVNSLGAENVLGLIMPEQDSSPQSSVYAKTLCEKFNVRSITIDLTQILTSFGIYSIRDQIIKKYSPNFNSKTKYRIVVPNRLINNTTIALPHLEILDEGNKTQKIRMSLYDYLELTAATNIKHRTRMIMLYLHAEKNHYLVAGTTNKSELMQGYYVKYGDGGVDIEPLGGLYKSQVYQLSKFLNIPEEIIKRNPSPDTWSFEVSDEDFFFGLPYKTLDLIWFANERNIDTNEIAKTLNLSNDTIKTIIDEQQKKWKISTHMRNMPPIGQPNIVLSDS